MSCTVSVYIISRTAPLQYTSMLCELEPGGARFRYNHKTYRVDGIEWNMNVSMKFKKGDEDISYVEYYKTVFISLHK